MDVEDIPAVVALLERVRSDSRYNLTFDAQGLTKVLVSATITPEMAVFVCLNRQGTIVGGLGAIVMAPMATKEVFAFEQFFVLDKTDRGLEPAMKLLNAYKAWATNLGAVVLNIYVDYGDDDERVARMLEHSGYRRQGIALRLEV